jgi:alpha,alpha-trehalase
MSDRIADFALLGDGHGAALVCRDGSVVWWCLPRFDAPSVLTQVLDERAGHWSLRPRDIENVERRYVPGTVVLETTFRCTGGSLLARQTAGSSCLKAALDG